MENKSNQMVVAKTASAVKVVKRKSGKKAALPVLTPHTRGRRKFDRPTRAERAVLLRARILKAAAEVVGEYGYLDASVSRIANVAGIAQGTIYLYFETRQHLFDELLPHTGQNMMHFIAEEVRGAKTFIEVEERGVRAFFKYLQDNPGFYRLLNEAEFAAPLGHQRHFEQLVAHYVASMKRSSGEGRLGSFSEQEMKVIAYTLMAARSYIYLGYVKYGRSKTPPNKVIETYMKLVTSSLQ